MIFNKSRIFHFLNNTNSHWEFPCFQHIFNFLLNKTTTHQMPSVNFFLLNKHFCCYQKLIEIPFSPLSLEKNKIEFTRERTKAIFDVPPSEQEMDLTENFVFDRKDFSFRCNKRTMKEKNRKLKSLKWMLSFGKWGYEFKKWTWGIVSEENKNFQGNLLWILGCFLWNSSEKMQKVSRTLKRKTIWIAFQVVAEAGMFWKKSEGN